MEQRGTGTNASEQIGNEKTYTIRGIAVLFPYNAYPSQLSMMNKASIALSMLCLISVTACKEACLA